MVARKTVLTSLIDDISGYFLDHCPEGINWEDFDPDLDWIRSLLQDCEAGDDGQQEFGSKWTKGSQEPTGRIPKST